MTRRSTELAEALTRVQLRISAAAERAGREDAVRLIAVTKFFPASDVVILADLGVTDVGENRHQEAVEKRASVDKVAPHLTWHFIGALQSNKATAVLEWADVVATVDRTKLVSKLSAAAHGANRTARVLVQLSLDQLPGSGASTSSRACEAAASDGLGERPELQRRGVSRSEALTLARVIEADDSLQLLGLMGVAPFGVDPVPAFAHLREVHEELVRMFPAARHLSAGMSGDLEAAIDAGATHVRIGSSLLGSRPLPR